MRCRLSYHQDTVLDKMAHKHIRVVVVGNVDAAKSTLIGTLVFNTLDDGRGLARSKIIKHKHELVTGRTASITSHLLGLETSSGAVKTVIGGYQKTVLQSDRIVSLMDVAGHEKYMKTTVGGVARGMAVRLESRILSEVPGLKKFAHSFLLRTMPWFWSMLLNLRLP
jgi:GTPase